MRLANKILQIGGKFQFKENKGHNTHKPNKNQNANVCMGVKWVKKRDLAVSIFVTNLYRAYYGFRAPLRYSNRIDT